MNLAEEVVQLKKRIENLERENKAMKTKSNVRGQGIITLHNNFEVDKSARVSEILNRLDALES